MSRLTAQQQATIGRAAVLLDRFGERLSDHERTLTTEVVRRFRRDGVRTVVTVHEMPVIEESAAAMAALKADLDEALKAASGGADDVARAL